MPIAKGARVRSARSRRRPRSRQPESATGLPASASATPADLPARRESSAVMPLPGVDLHPGFAVGSGPVGKNTSTPTIGAKKAAIALIVCRCRRRQSRDCFHRSLRSSLR